MTGRMYRAQILLQPEQHKSLAEIAEREKRSVSQVVREILREYLSEKREDARFQREMKVIIRLYQIREESNERYGVYRGDLVAEARAERLDHSKTCDAHYLALAGEMGVEFWTADERLVKGARQAGAGWVRWVMEPV